MRANKRRLGVLTAAVALMLPVSGKAIASAGTDKKAPLGAPALTDEAVDLEAKMVDHLWYGQVQGVTFDSPEQLPGHVVGLHEGGDSALWSGVYLAGESFRYAVAKRSLAEARGQPAVSDAQAELAAAKARVDTLVWSAHRRINISANWDPEPADPSRSPLDGGLGGVVHGEAGAAFRECFPTGVPAWQQDQTPSPRSYTFGPMAWDDRGDPDGVISGTWYCDDASSRDVYAGTTFGLLEALDLVGPDDHQLQRLVGNDLMLMTDYLVRHGWSVVRPHTRVSTGGSENFVFPLFVINPEPRLNMTQAARHAAQVVGTAADQAKWEAVWHEELATQGPWLFPEALIAIEQPDTYYNFNLNHLTFYNTIREEQDAATRDLIERAFSVIDATTRDDINAHFEAITYALTGEAQRRDAAIQHLVDWMYYRSTSEQSITNSSRCGHDLACVPEKEVELDQATPAGTAEVSEPPAVQDLGTVTRPDTTLRAADPLPIKDRPRHQDFLWQRPPWQLDGGFNPNEREPGVDFLTPYWMLRYDTEVAIPPVAPLPPWAGPTTR